MALFRTGIGRGIQPLSKQEIWAVTEHLPFVEHFRESIHHAACLLPHQTKARHGSSFICYGFSGIIVNTGNLTPTMTTENVSEIRLFHIYSGYMPLEWLLDNAPGWLSVSQTHMSNRFFLPAFHLPLSHLCLIQATGDKCLDPDSVGQLNTARTRERNAKLNSCGHT